jgi:hypothetical protein
MVVSYGYGFGFCVGYCKYTVKMESAGVTHLKQGYGKGGQLPDSSWTSLSNGALWSNLENEVAALNLDTFKISIALTLSKLLFKAV